LCSIFADAILIAVSQRGFGTVFQPMNFVPLVTVKWKKISPISFLAPRLTDPEHSGLLLTAVAVVQHLARW
jgi:hypothetical protein